MSDFYWVLIVEHEFDNYKSSPAVTLTTSFDAAMAIVRSEFAETIDSMGVSESDDDTVINMLGGYGVHIWIEQAMKPKEEN